MREVSSYEIAAALAGHPSDPSAELRLLMLFQSNARDGVEMEPETIREPLSKAA